jgi:hypothetical protein
MPLARELNRDDIGKVFMIFENDPNRHNRMFILESIDPIQVKYANYDDTLSHVQALDQASLSREIVQIPISANLINELRKYTPSGLNYLEVEAAKERKSKESSGGAKKTLKKKRKYKKRI